ncbi:hypothetical protein C815_02015 [Firmicutes bacterium M10-2]|nr:hypothetical protein C815_02015 [Firmicutes bacterium M10-2]
MIKKYKIILTVNLDGPEEVNNKNRISRDGGNVYKSNEEYRKIRTKWNKNPSN